MAKQSSVNLDITNNADGFDISGGTTARKLTATGADITLTGSGSNTYTFPDASCTLAANDLGNLGTTAINSALLLATSDAAALGSATKMWSDLFLAAGGVINWDNGNATLTHSAGALAINVPVSLGTSNALTCGTIELGNASDTTLARVSAGVVSIEGVNIATISATQTLTNKTFGDGGYKLGLPSADHTAVGPTTNAINSGATVAAFELVFLGTDGKWLLVDADAVATCKGMMGLALEAKNDTEAMNVALPGSFVRDDTWNWTVGATLYAGETPGTMQEAIPTGADAIIKVVGFAVSADVVFFNPSPDQQSTVA